jgi:Tfp pilus assembly protein PilF
VALLVARQDGSVLAETSLAFAAGEIQSLPVALRSDAPVTLDLNGQEVTLRLEGDSVRAALDAVPPHTAVPDKLTEEEPKTPSGWLLRAREHEERNDIQAAAEACRKALDLDPLCAAAMAGLAQWHLKRSETAEAKEWAAKALQTDLQHEDALWWLGVADVLGPKDDRDATAHLHALRRSPRYAAAALTLLGELALRRRDPRAAFRFLAAALERNSLDSRAWALAAFAARASGDQETATTFLDQCEEENPLEPLLWSERYFLAGSGGVDAYLQRVFGRDPQPYLEAACDYERLGAWDAAAAWLSGVALRRAHPARHAMPLYHAAHALWHLGKPTEAVGLAREAAKQSPLFIFPHRHEDGQALRTALVISPDDALAHYLLGTWLASLGRWDDAFPHWTRAAQLAPAGETAVLAWRNIALMKWRKGENAPESLSAYSSALDLLSGISDLRLPIADLKTPNPEPQTPNTAHPTLLSLSSWRLWLERDRVLAAAGRHAERIAAFGSAPDDVKAKWQVLARWAEAYLRAGQAEQALGILSRCRFKPWEGEGRSRASWKEAHMLLGHRAKDGGDLATARKHFEAAAEYPRHLGVGKPLMTDDADALFWAGWCALQTGDREAARRLLTLAANEPQPRDATSADFKSRAADALEQLRGLP